MPGNKRRPEAPVSFTDQLMLPRNVHRYSGDPLQLQPISYHNNAATLLCLTSCHDLWLRMNIIGSHPTEESFILQAQGSRDRL
ncbi:hypothetical protein SRHO_G00246300 [Serrasalmus rhombeus]